MMDAFLDAADFDDADLRAWKRAYRSLQVSGSQDCLSEEQFLAMLSEHLCGAARTNLADHIVQCQRCTDLYQLLLRLPPSGS